MPADFVAKLRRLQRLLDRIDETLDGLLFTLIGPAKRVGASMIDDGPTRVGAPPPSAWIEQLEASVRADGTVEVEIDEKRFDLQPHLGALLLALAEDTGASIDDCVGFKTMADLSLRIGKISGGAAPSRNTVNKYIHKLRHVLAERAGLTDDVIQTNRVLGRRLAVKRSGLTPW